MFKFCEKAFKSKTFNFWIPRARNSEKSVEVLYRRICSLFSPELSKRIEEILKKNNREEAIREISELYRKAYKNKEYAEAEKLGKVLIVLQILM